MAAYIVARVNVQNRNAYQEYMRHTPRVIRKYGGRFMARGGQMVTLEGPEEKLRIVLIEFPSLENAKAFYQSPEYAQIKKLREGGGEVQFVAIDGYAVTEWDAVVQASEKLTLPN